MNILVLVCIALALIYGVLIIIVIAGWHKSRPIDTISQPGRQTNLSFSVIVAARNEEQNIRSLLGDLLDQDYKAGKLSIIVVNDHSTDKTDEIVKEYCLQNNNISLISLNSGENGKKAALLSGASHADSDILAFVDADCRVKGTWISVASRYFNSCEPNMLVGPVDFQGTTSIESFQRLEMTALVGFAAASVALKKPVLCNGANLFYRKDFFMQIQTMIKPDIASGDDIFMLQAARTIAPDKIHFLKDKDAIVSTKACNSLREFIQQRLRWASKNRHYSDRLTNVIALIIFAYCLVSTGLVLGSIFNPALFLLGLSMIAFKSLMDLLFFVGIMKFFNSGRLLFLLPLYELIYPVYVVIIGIISQLPVRYSWKGRRIRR